MLFNSINFLVFFLVVTTLFFLLPHRFRWILLLVSSSIFYMFFIPIYILILFFTIIIDYYAGILIENEIGRKRKMFLAMSLVANIGVLAIFKYYNFFIENINSIAQLLDWNYSITALGIILPIGLSFHTFQAMSYTIEVYRGNQKAERHLGIYAVYVMFYPQLVAGPIERPQNLIHQFYEKHRFDFQRIVEGLRLMLWGFFKKVVIADRLAFFVDKIYNDPTTYHGTPLIIGTVFFAVQIYCDFSGYSDIAIGSAKVMGFTLMNNFSRPYFSKTIAEFWTRWHISLSTWFRDYLYIPLGGNRVSKLKWYRNIFIVFLISGLWHGANWTYVIWGGLHGFYSVFESATAKIRGRIASGLWLNRFPTITLLGRIAITFSLVTFAWIFFRSNSLKDASYISSHLFDFHNSHFDPRYIITQVELTGLGIPFSTGLTRLLFLESIVFIFALPVFEIAQDNRRFDVWLTGTSIWKRWTIYAFLFFSITIFGFESEYQFVYFQF